MENLENGTAVTDQLLMSKLQEQFDAQRARMRDLLIFKESECTQLKQKALLLKKELEEKDSQLVIAEYSRLRDLEDQKNNAQAEISTLQQLLQETCDEHEKLATLANNEIIRLSEENEKLKKGVVSSMQQQQDSNKIESILGLKTLARNVKKITGVSSNSQENLDITARKVASSTSSKYAQEDADTLRSLVVPLEDEIQQLKQKLREAYEEMEKTRGKNPTKSALVGLLSEAQEESSELKKKADLCSMCKNYENQLVQIQEELESEKLNTVKAEKVIVRLQQDLLKESDLRLDLEKTWQNKREEHKEEVQKMCVILNNSEQRLSVMQNEFTEFKADLKSRMVEVVEERQEFTRYLETLQRDNEYLSGLYLQHSDELKAQDINLPQTIEGLQEKLIILNENLIESKVGMEFNQAKCISFRDEASLLRDQLQKKEKEREFLEQKLHHRIRSLEDKLKNEHHIHLKLLDDKERLHKVETDNKKEISDLRMQLISLRDDVERLEKNKVELKSRVQMMQQELSTSETVSKDFVKLSQQLQMQLEKIRSADNSVRWQDEEDCSTCPACKNDFTVTRRKKNCRHCGTIYCESCCNRPVKSGPNGKNALVCEFCQFLLESNSTPFFSHATPKSP